MLTEPGLNTLQRKEVEDLISALRTEVEQLRGEVEELRERQSWYVVKDSELWRF
jgi:hypothetical protein